MPVEAQSAKEENVYFADFLFLVLGHFQKFSFCCRKGVDVPLGVLCVTKAGSFFLEKEVSFVEGFA